MPIYVHGEETHQSTHSRHHIFANCLHQPLISDLQASMSSGCVGDALGIELRNLLNYLKRYASATIAVSVGPLLIKGGVLSFRENDNDPKVLVDTNPEGTGVALVSISNPQLEKSGLKR